MKFPYGMADFKEIVTEDYYYCDRTDKIPLLEKAKSQLFIRPRRFGKSLLLSMLENYYDVAEKEDFEKIFGGLHIGNKPTESRNSYFILRWDFSCVDAGGSMEDIKRSLFNHINARISRFVDDYSHAGFDFSGVEINRTDALVSMESLLSHALQQGYPVYLLLDEYDNFANTIMMQGGNSRERYEELVHDQGILKTLFKTVKSLTSTSGFDRVFITGVSPVVLSDITSGYNIATNIYFEPEFNDLCGFRESEIKNVLKKLAKGCEGGREMVDQAFALAKTYYNGYRFCREETDHIYNPTLSLYFFRHLHDKCEFPFEMLDANLAADESKLEYIGSLPQGREMMFRLSQKGEEVAVGRISNRFGLQEMLSDASKDQVFLVSYLYYFGVLTLSSLSEMGEIVLKVPNLVVQSLYVERVQQLLIPDPRVRDEGTYAAKQVYQQGDIAPLCDFVQNTSFKVFKNRDYRWANELTLKTAFLTLLYNDILYIMDSEPETGRRYADLTMIIRPDMRRFKILDVLLEFKFIPLKDVGMSGDNVGDLDDDQAQALPVVGKAFEEGENQVRSYGASLNAKYGNLRLQKFVVVTLGFERVVWRRVE